MTADSSLRDVLISRSRTHAEADLFRLTMPNYRLTLAISVAGLFLIWTLLPRRMRWIATALLTAASAWAARDWLCQNVAALTSGEHAWPCFETGDGEAYLPEPSTSLVDLYGHQSFPASDPPGNL